MRPQLVRHLRAGERAGARAAAVRRRQRGLLGGDVYDGIWENVGTADQLLALNHSLVTR